MIAAPAPSIAAQRTQAAYQEMLQRQREVALARLKRARAHNIRLALWSAVILAVGVGLGFRYGLPASLHSAAPDIKKTAEPVDPFVTTRIGQIRTPYKRDMCRQVNFDNVTGAVAGESVVPCEGAEPGPGGASSTQARARMESLRDAFSR
jgi:hypothetical protein